MLKKISISSDHTGVALKKIIKDYLTTRGFTIDDYGCHSDEKAVDYPDYVTDVVTAVLSSKALYGILICGTGVGMSIAANRWPNIRAALCYNAEIAQLSREHNDANVLCIGARYTDAATAIEIIVQFFNTKFADGRHSRRIAKLERKI